MRIVFIAPFGVRPKGTVLARMVPLAVSLQMLGHNVTVVAPPYTNPEDSGRTETVNDVEIRNIRLGPGNKALSALVLGRRLYRAAMAEKPDIVHLFKPKGYGGVAAFVHIMLRRLGSKLPPLFVDVDDWEGAGGMNRQLPYNWVERMVFSLQEEWLQKKATGITAASRVLYSRALDMGITPERVLYLPNCVDDSPPCDGSKVRERLGFPANASVLLLYTRFFEFEQERLHLLLAEIHRHLPGVRILVVGKGRKGEERELLKAAESLGFAPALHMAGWLEPEEIPVYLAVGDVAIYPFSDTLVNRAKCPAKLTEILLAGVPVVADNVGQITEYLDGGRCGILCDPQNWREMADRTVLLLSDPEKRRALGEAGRRNLLTNFRWSVFAPKLITFYESNSRL